MTCTVGDLLASASDAGLDRLDAQILLAHALDWPRSAVLARPDDTAPEIGREYFRRLLRQHADGTPVAYLIGEREFWSLPLKITAETLIPRPETELLVETALRVLPNDGAVRVLDLGTGSGAIALALASERPQWDIVATDISRGALAVAEANALRLGFTNVRFVHSHWWDAVPNGVYDLIVSNPPYVASGDPHLDEGTLPGEPTQALVGGDSGLEALHAIVDGAQARMAPGGFVLVEHGHDQRADVLGAMTAAGLKRVCGLRDMAGIDRAAMARNGVGLVVADDDTSLFDA